MKMISFQKFMNAIDDDLLEEAQVSKKKFPVSRFAIIAACVLVCVLAVNLLPIAIPGKNADIRVVSAEDLLELGYDMPLPDDAQVVGYYLKEQKEFETPMAQICFTTDGVEYLYSAQFTEQPQERTSQEEVVTDTGAKIDLWVGSTQKTEYVSWFTEEKGIQWWVESENKDAQIITTAQQILEVLGLNMDVAPEGAENESFHVESTPSQETEELVIAETLFTLDGVNYSYRTAATIEIKEDFADISGLDKEYQCSSQVKVGWCSARLYYNPGEDGKIVWFDIAPGLLYSLSMDNGASEETLINMAEELYNPAQKDVP